MTEVLTKNLLLLKSPFFSKLQCWIFHLIRFTPISVGPLDVELIGRKDPVSVGRLYEFRCQSVGARPPPHITWWRGSIQLRENVTSRVSQNQQCISNKLIT